MTDYLKHNHLSLLIVLWLIVSPFLGHSLPALGVVAPNLSTISNPVTFSNTQTPGGVAIASSTLTTVKVGASGTQQTNHVITTCSIISNGSASASTTVYGYCTGVSGVTSTDLIDANFASSTTVFQDNWWLAGAKASTTAGAIDFRIYNGSGRAQAFSAATTLGSSTVIRAGH